MPADRSKRYVYIDEVLNGTLQFLAAGAFYRIRVDGSDTWFELKNVTTGNFHPLLLQGDPPGMVVGPASS